MKKIVQTARTLRKNQTQQEYQLWQLLRNRNLLGCKFRRQYPIDKYIVDFVCLDKLLVIELDGGQHNETANITYDNERTAYLESKGFHVLRFWNNELNDNIEGVYEKIINLLQMSDF